MKYLSSNNNKKHTIKRKILLSISSMILISLTILGVVSAWLNYYSTMDLLEQNMTEMAVVASDRVAKELQAYTNVAIDTGCIARLSDPAQSTESKKKITDQAVNTHGLVRGNLLDMNGISLYDGKDFSDRIYFQEARKGKAYVSEPVLSKISGELTMPIGAPVWKGGVAGSEIAGVVYFIPPETFLNDIVSDINISKNGAAYMINSSGITIADNTLKTIMIQNIEEEAKSDSSLRELAEIHGRMRRGENGFAPYVINGKRKFSAFAPVPGTDGWSIAITAPQSDFMGTTYAAIITTIVLVVASVIIGSLIAFRLAARIGNPIRMCAERLQKLAGGDLHSEVPKIEEKDETGILAGATAELVENVSGIIKDVDWGLSEMAAGNFTVDSSAADLYVGDFASLKESMYKILSHLTETLLQINQSADQVASGAEQVSAGAQALSQGATEQASSIEELAATMNEITDRVKQNADSARLASRQADKVGDEVTISNDRMQEMLGAITDIRDDSSEIKKIIKTIEDIAFQTNILALNAAVEAARAGAAGKGFAVVADEVRNLAGKSAEASKNTAGLIEKSLVSVENGTKIAKDTADSLEAVVNGIKEVTDSIGTISEASDQQANAADQAKQGIDQISSVVQNNSATAEESAAASEELSGQAQLLKQMIGNFRLKNNNTE